MLASSVDQSAVEDEVGNGVGQVQATQNPRHKSPLIVYFQYVLSFYPCKGMLLVVVLHMYIPLYILAQCRALESTVAIS